MYKQDLALNNLQRLICQKTQPTNQPTIWLCAKNKIIYLKYMYKQNLTLNNLQCLICHKTKPSKSWMGLLAFHFTRIPFGKAWIHAFSHHLWVNNWIDLVRQPVLEKENTEFSPVELHLKIDLVSQPVNDGISDKFIRHVV